MVQGTQLIITLFYASGRTLNNRKSETTFGSDERRQRRSGEVEPFIFFIQKRNQAIVLCFLGQMSQTSAAAAQLVSFLSKLENPLISAPDVRQVGVTSCSPLVKNHLARSSTSLG